MRGYILRKNNENSFEAFGYVTTKFGLAWDGNVIHRDCIEAMKFELSMNNLEFIESDFRLSSEHRNISQKFTNEIILWDFMD